MVRTWVNVHAGRGIKAYKRVWEERVTFALGRSVWNPEATNFLTSMTTTLFGLVITLRTPLAAQSAYRGQPSPSNESLIGVKGQSKNFCAIHF